jgi:hypothetical protein
MRDTTPEEPVAAVPVAQPRGNAPAPEPSLTPEAAPAPVRRRAETPPVAPAEPVAEAPAPVVEAEPTAGTLRIDSDVPGAQIFVDRQFVGAAPAVAENLTPGSHQVNVSAPGYDSVVTSIDVAPGNRDLVVKLREVRLDTSTDVIHKHGVGSCRGRLVATPQGIRYETSNRDDAFTSPLLDLETFQVDYLQKNLRVKLPKGRQFNFTDPDGNADRLFVFHRDVEKARERLKKGDTPAPR